MCDELATHRLIRLVRPDQPLKKFRVASNNLLGIASRSRLGYSPEPIANPNQEPANEWTTPPELISI